MSGYIFLEPLAETYAVTRKACILVEMLQLRLHCLCHPKNRRATEVVLF